MRERDDDHWLGALYQFPTILHARAALSFDMSPKSFQKALLSALSSLRASSTLKEISIADRDGYVKGRVQFRVGVGNGDGFDILDAKEEERVLDHIESRGVFDTLDLAFHLHYKIDDDQKHKVHEDHYLIRLAFERGRVEVLVHHLRGLRRVQPIELVRIVLDRLNSVLVHQRFQELTLETVNNS